MGKSGMARRASWQRLRQIRHSEVHSAVRTAVELRHQPSLRPLVREVQKTLLDPGLAPKLLQQLVNHHYGT